MGCGVVAFIFVGYRQMGVKFLLKQWLTLDLLPLNLVKHYET